jgi:putative ABC transport system permease protein
VHLRDFRVGWRVLVREPAYSLVVVAGLALGLAACILLFGFIDYSFNYDCDVPDNEHVYVLKHRLSFIPQPQWLEPVPRGFRDSVRASGLASASTIVLPRKVTLSIQARPQEQEVLTVDPDFAAIFGLHPLQGDVVQALSHPEGLALTVKTALRLFGGADVVGKTVKVDKEVLTVMAVLPDPPDNTTVPYEALIGMASLLRSEAERNPDERAAWLGIGGRIYVRLKPGVSAATLAAAMQGAGDRSPWQRMPDMQRFPHVIELSVGTLHDAYFDTTVANAFGSGPRGDKATLLGLAVTGLLILLLATTNFINLATVRVMRRRREIGMRKVLGAGASRVLAQFLAESLLVALLAAVLGLLLAWLLLPLMGELVGRKLDHLFSPALVAASLCGAVLTGLAAGAYPAWVAQRTTAADALAGRGNSETVNGLRIRRGLTVLQFATASGLCAMTLAVGCQTLYALRIDPGFDPAPLLLVSLPRSADTEAVRSWHAALQKLPGVSDVAASSRPIGDPGAKGLRWTFTVGRPGTPRLPVMLGLVSPNFLAAYRIRPLAGRLFDANLSSKSQDRLVVISATAVHALGFASPQDAIGKTIIGDYPMTVLGVVPEVRNQSLHEVVQPTLYLLDEKEMAVTSIVGHGDQAALGEAVAALWVQRFPGIPLAMRSAGSVFAAHYTDDIRLAKLVASASIVAMALAAFGIYALAAHTVQRRYREITLRKLHGASPGAIALLIGREFGILLALGAVIGLPLAAVAIDRFLSSFVERAPMGILPLLAALAMTAAVAAIASMRHTIAAMRLAPVLALRD